MKIIGIVSEYNPFHNGHEYQIKKCRELYGEDAAVVCVMSGDFVQRGEAAIMSKYARAEAACLCGADIVAELPLPWSLSSAEGFATGAVSILARLGVAQLCFGTESEDAQMLEHIARLLLREDVGREILKTQTDNPELSYAAARQIIISRYIGEKAELIKKPNSILAVEYYKAVLRLGLSIGCTVIKRRGAEHDGSEKSGGFASASELRRMLLAGEDISEYVPQRALDIYRREAEQGRIIDLQLLDTALLARLRALDSGSLEILRDGADGLGRRLHSALRATASVESAAYAASTKRYTAARAKRLCISAALNVSKADGEGLPPYTRLLAMSEKGCALLRERKENDLAIITKPASARHMDAKTAHLFAAGANAHDLYVLAFRDESQRKCDEDWKTGPKIVHFI